MGTRQSALEGKVQWWDHPHAYGDKTQTRYAVSVTQGSSPRVWGQGSGVILSPMLSGIIPTRMGTSRLCAIIDRSCRDHPHAYGDKLICPRNSTLSMGSSPRVWGQEGHTAVPSACSRIIPTRMGTRGGSSGDT